MDQCEGLGDDMADDRFALCLSGGGLRATLFHLGVIEALRGSFKDGRSALSHISEVYSVSGGAILAAHMALRWESYIGEDAAFAEAKGEIFKLARRNMRDRLLRRSALTKLPLLVWNLFSARPFSGRIYWLQREYESLLGNARIDERCTGQNGKPRFTFLTTNIKTGELCAFSDTTFEVEQDKGVPLATPCGHLPLSQAVVCSSAFPPLLPPVLIDDCILARPRDDAFLQPMMLTDGGVYDNLGIEKYWRDRERKEGSSRVIVSNAGSPLRTEAGKTYASTVPRNVRTADILMDRVGGSAEREIERSDHDILIRLDSASDRGTLDPAVQQLLRLVRTDLDYFGKDICELLVEQGRSAASQELEQVGWSWAGEVPERSASPSERSRQEHVAQKAAKRSFAMLVFDLRDWRTLSVLWAMFGAVISLSALTIGDYLTTKEEEQKAEDDMKEELALKSSQILQALAVIRNDRLTDIEKIFKTERVLIGIRNRTRTQRDIEYQDQKEQQSRASEGVAQSDTSDNPVYIQYAESLTREQIVGLSQQLNEAGWKVQGSTGERIASAAGLREIRYGIPDNMEAAQKLADDINSAKLVRGKVTVRQMRIIGPDNLEVWISN